MESTEKLVADIQKAFAGISKPNGTLRVARGADDHDHDWRKLQKLDDHYSAWEDIPSEDLEHYQDVFTWLCPEGYRFYLPAYMVHFLTANPQTREKEIWRSRAFNSYCVEKGQFELFTPAEAAVTCRFLESSLLEVYDEDFPDWWNHPWHKDWSELDELKAELWAKYGAAYEYMKAKLTR
ncbi:MAG: hypothetical protein K0Q55_470 [Verrucomicrobia bacterium]|jgi:hypothetical protein|nr:hypothetical protein [Verrucomicrobiota bacterium]